MTLRTRLDRLERDAPGNRTALDDLLASIAARGLRIHDRPADLVMGAPADRNEVAAFLDTLRRTPSQEVRP